MQASILPKRADHEAQKLGFLPLTSVAEFFGQRSARCGVAGRHSAARAVAGRSARQRRDARPAIVRHSVRHSAQLTFAGIRPLQQKLRNIIPVFVLCNADSVIGCFSSISGYLSGQFTYNAPLNEKTHKRSV